MKIGLLSDTHDQVERIKKAITFFNDQEVDLLIHCGDWCAPFGLILYKELKCPIKSVFGNNDGDIFKHLLYSKRFGLALEFMDKFAELDIDGRKIALLHGDPASLVQSLFDGKTYDAIFCGHTHQAEIRENEKTLLVNSGTLVPKVWDHWTEPSVGVYDSKNNSAEIIKI